MRLRRFAGLFAILAIFGGTTVPARAIDPKLLPNDTEIAFTVNFQQLMKSELAKTHKSLIDQVKDSMKGKLAEKGADKALERMGFDFFRDFGSFTVASPGSTDPESVFVLVNGNFAWDKLKSTAVEEAQAQGKNLKVINVGSAEAFEITADSEKTVYAGLITPKTMAVTLKKQAYEDAVGRGAGTKGGNSKQEFKRLLGSVSESQTVSFATTGAAIIRLLENAPIPNAEQVVTYLQQIDGLTASLTVEKNVGFQLAVMAKDAQTAETMAKMANGGLSFVRAMAKKKAEEDERAKIGVDVANTLRISSNGSNVILRGELTAENIDFILKNIPKR